MASLTTFVQFKFLLSINYIHLKEKKTMLSKNLAMSAALAMVSLFSVSSVIAETKTLKISHQFPAGTDFRDQLVKKFAADVEKRTNGTLKFEIYSDSSLMKTN